MISKLTGYQSAPGQCATCGSPQNPGVDLGLTEDYLGAIMLCEDCAKHVGRVVGLIDAPVESEAKAETLGDEDIERLNAILNSTMRVFDDMRSVVSGLSDKIKEERAESAESDESTESDGQDASDAGDEGSFSVSSSPSNEQLGIKRSFL